MPLTGKHEATGRRTAERPRVVALLATFNERRFVAPCLEHLRSQGVKTYLIDNSSDDETVEIAERYLGDGLLGIETLPRERGVFELGPQLRRKEELAAELDADWIVHLDADEFRLPPPGGETLAEALAAVDRQGYNAVNFLEFTFLPTREDPDHDHAEFRQTLRTYYPFAPVFPHRLTAWKAGREVALTPSGGHVVEFPGLKMYPDPFPAKHYLFLSIPHAIEKYVQRDYDATEVKMGGHGWRARISADDLRLPKESEVRVARNGSDLDPSHPWHAHYLDPAGTND